MALRITKQGLEAIGVKDVAVGAPMETSVSPAPDRTEVEAHAVKVVASRKRASVATQTSVRTRQQTTCLPNGPASTRCLGFRPNSCPFEPNLWQLRSPLPGNGIYFGEAKKAP